MKVLIIDDEKHCREVIQSFMKDYCPTIERVEEASDVDSGLRKITSLKPDIVFLDIQLNNRTCFELLDQLDQINFQIIFTTAYDDYAIKAFEYAAVHYWLKPLTPKIFIEAIQRCVSKELIFEANTLEKAKGIYFETMNSAFNIPLDEITHIIAAGSYSTVYQANGENFFATKKLADYDSLLNNNFYRIHRSIIVNMDFVKRMDKNNNLVILSNAVELSIARRKKSAFRQVFKNR